MHRAKIIENRNDNEKVINQKHSEQEEVELEKNKSKVEKGKDDKAATDTQKDVEFKDMLDFKEAFIAEKERNCWIESRKVAIKQVIRQI